MSVLDPKEDVAALTPLVEKTVESITAAITAALATALDGYTVSISPITITVTKQVKS